MSSQTDLDLLINYIAHIFFAVIIPFLSFYSKKNFTCVYFFGTFSLCPSRSKICLISNAILILMFYISHILHVYFFFSCKRMHSLPGAFSPTGTSSDTIKKLLFPSRSFARPSSWLSPRAMRWAPFVAGFTGRELDVQATTTSRVSARIFKRGRGSWLIFACAYAYVCVRVCVWNSLDMRDLPSVPAKKDSQRGR